MRRFSKKSEYGLMAVHYIAFHQQDGVVNSKRIAEDLGIPAELLAKILQRLSKGKLIASVNGPKGGYVLAREPSNIRVSEVLRIRRPVLAIQSGIERFLETMTLETMNTMNEPAPVASRLVAARH